MLSQADNDLLCEVDPGKPMHRTLKRYWLPVALSADVPEPDSPPVRVTALCEDYVLFRDSAGELGLLRESCCHRGASLCLGRVEEGGIRCLYHGWKFSVSGTILDMPNAADDRYKEKYRQPAFAVREAGGFVWAYLGDAEQQPAFPDLPFFHVPAAHRVVECPVFNANFLQVLEGGLDSSHLGFLHRDSLTGASAAGEAKLAGQVQGSTAKSLSTQYAPYLEIEETSFGFRYAAIRAEKDVAGQDIMSVGVTAFAMPTTCLLRGGTSCIMALPVTNDRTYFFHCFWDLDRPIAQDGTEAQIRQIFGLHDRAMRDFGLSRETNGLPQRANRANNYLQDRAAMRRGESFTGIMNFIPEDAAVVASAGPIYDRRWENLIPADAAIVKARRLLTESVARVSRGEEPIGLNPEDKPRGTQGTLRPGVPWQKLCDVAQPQAGAA